MKAFIGIEEKECTVRCGVVYGDVYVISVRDCRDGTDVRGYLDQRVLDQLANDWLAWELQEDIEKQSWIFRRSKFERGE